MSIDEFNSIINDLTSLGIVKWDSRDRYFCTPIEARILAGLGSDGIHFCLISRNEYEDIELSPVYVISPMMPEHYVELIASSFEDFIALLIECKDATALEYVSYSEEEAFNRFLVEIDRGIIDACDFNEKVHSAIKRLQSIFGIRSIDNIYQHIQLTRSKLENHAPFTFSKEYFDLII